MIETIANATGEIVSLDEAKQQLRVWDSAEDARVRLMLEAARAYCEEWSESTLRLSATRTASNEGWPAGGWGLRHPPVSAVNSITYYDQTNTLRTLSSSNYRVTLTAAGCALVAWADNASGFTLPGIADRPDAVTVTYTTGWGTAEAAPADAKAAVLLVLQWIDGQADHKSVLPTQVINAAQQILAGRSAWNYA